ncbi:MAG: outer membrane lipoprotein LolB [Burkholderiaceae bacterium]|nr:outer membrane lipoprotein LolB [Burkholderiaceae bacterium]
MRAWRCLALLGACVAVAACVTPTRMASTPGAEASFSRAGRFALTVTQAGGRQDAVQGGFSWLDERDRYVLDLTNPLGSTQARVEGRPGAAVLTRANGERLSAADPDALAEEALGSRIPVAGLRDWFQGRLASAPAASDVTHDSQGRVQAFEQGGWQAKLSRYDEAGPQLLVLERRETDRRIVLRLVVDPA